MSRGRFITLEGIEGAGKSSIARLLLEELQARKVPVLLTREPGGTPLAERIRELVLQPQNELIDAPVETLLMFAARGIHLANRVRPALASGQWVLCDRFTDATRAYQGAGRGVPASLIEALAAAIHADLLPDLTLLLDLPVAIGLSRARGRATASDRFEQERASFFERVRAAYLEIARREAGRVRIIDATQPLEAVLAQAREAVAALGLP